MNWMSGIPGSPDVACASYPYAVRALKPRQCRVVMYAVGSCANCPDMSERDTEIHAWMSDAGHLCACRVGLIVVKLKGSSNILQTAIVLPKFRRYVYSKKDMLRVGTVPSFHILILEMNTSA